VSATLMKCVYWLRWRLVTIAAVGVLLIILVFLLTAAIVEWGRYWIERILQFQHRGPLAVAPRSGR
jgi:hypothetical protein